jgi:hypothetical protein
MGQIYAHLIDAGYDPLYLDNSTLLDLDLYMRQTNALRKKQGPRLR